MPIRRHIHRPDDARRARPVPPAAAPPSAAVPPPERAQPPLPAPQAPGGSFDDAAAHAAARYFDGDTSAFLDDLPVIQAYARSTRGPLLELGCGTGRLLVPLARAGYRVTGVDLSLDMLGLAQAKVASAGLAERVTLLQGDFGRVALPETYRFAFIVMNTFLHLLSRAEQLQALRHWHGHLAPSGLLLIDVFAPDVSELAGLQGQVEFDKSWVDPASGATVMKQFIRTVDQAEQLVHAVMIYDEIAPDGQLRRTAVPFDLRYVWRFEAELLLEQAGFIVEDVFGDWDLTPFDSASERLIIVAHKA
jgi:SAM-dependent methyltransferase